MPTPAPTSTLIPAGADLPRPYYAGPEWKTDFSKHSVKYSEIIAVRPPRDTIPPLDDPEFFLLSDVENYMPPEWPVLSLEINGEDVVVFFGGGTLSPFSGALTPDIKRGSNRVVGSTGIFEPFTDGRKLTFTLRGDEVVDEETGSTWNIFGLAVDGPLKGTQLAPVVHANHFWFAWAAFNADTTVRTVEELD